MAWLEELRVRDLRCVRQADLSLSEGLTWFCGENGAGKTTLLEAVYLLDRGRSFRGRRAGPLATEGAKQFDVSGVLRDGEGRWRLRWLDASRTERFPRSPFVRLVGSSTFWLLEGGPSLRRRFVDWSMFHVEPGCEGVAREAARLVLQRNAWLRSGATGPAVWDDAYAEAFGVLSRCRSRYVETVNVLFTDLTDRFLPSGTVSIKWHGAVFKGEFRSALESQLGSDRQRGFTQLSPWRGDLVFERSGNRWCGSRGENKLAGTLLQLAVHRGAAADRITPVVLVDDPYAEVASEHASRLIGEWLRASDQVIVAALTRPPSDVPDAAMFHVERGRPSSLPERLNE